MTARQQAALTVNAALTGLVVWAIGHLLRGPDAEPSAPADIGVGALVVAALLVVSWANQPEAGP